MLRSSNAQKEIVITHIIEDIFRFRLVLRIWNYDKKKKQQKILKM